MLWFSRGVRQGRAAETCRLGLVLTHTAGQIQFGTLFHKSMSSLMVSHKRAISRVALPPASNSATARPSIKA